MIRFIKILIAHFLVLICIAYMLDFLYSYVYTNNKVIRNKVQFVFQNKNTSYDYIFLGSSRVENHINTNYIEKNTGKRSLNLGVSGQDLSETFLMLKLLKSNNISAKKYFIQIDENFEIKKVKSFLGASYFMPFIKDETIKTHLKEYDQDFIYDYYIPFYKYLNYGYVIGYREFLLNIFKKKRKHEFFVGQNKTSSNSNAQSSFKNTYNINNKLMNDIFNFVNENNFELISFTAPYYNSKNTQEFEKITKNYNIHLYIDSIPQVHFFKDKDHLNTQGANKFTKMLIRDFNLNDSNTFLNHQ